MMYYRGTFIKELPNRFRALVRIGNEDVCCYVPTSCKLGSLLDLQGKQVILKDGDRCLSLWSVLYGNCEVLVDSSFANELALKELTSPTRNSDILCREKTVSGYKFDLYDSARNVGYEVKSLITTAEQIVYPNCVSERRIRQLHKLKALAATDVKIEIWLIAMSGNARCVIVDLASEFGLIYGDYLNRELVIKAFAVTPDYHLSRIRLRWAKKFKVKSRRMMEGNK